MALQPGETDGDYRHLADFEADLRMLVESHPDKARLLGGLGRACAHYNGYRPQKSIDLYETTGTTSDYAYGVFGSIGYTFEHAGSSFHPPFGATVPQMYDNNREALILLCEEMCLLPALRPASRPLPGVLVEGKDAGAAATPFVYGTFNHAVLRGRLVDAAGAGLKGTVTLRKNFETLLWRNGDGDNPTGQASVTEHIETSMDTEDDGSFVYHVNPSTRPYLAFQGQTEVYELQAVAADGVTAFTTSQLVKRGEDVDLGPVTLG